MIPPPLNVLLLPIWPVVHIISFLMECCCPSSESWSFYKNLDDRSFDRMQKCHFWNCSCLEDWNCWKCKRRSAIEQHKRSGVDSRSRGRRRGAICRFYCYAPCSRLKCCTDTKNNENNAYEEIRHYHSSCSGQLLVGTRKRRGVTFDKNCYGVTMSEYLEKYGMIQIMISPL